MDHKKKEPSKPEKPECFGGYAPPDKCERCPYFEECLEVWAKRYIMRAPKGKEWKP